jgi:hypothetical protein
MKSKAKYRSHKVVVDGHTFGSKKEARRYDELLLLERTGVISCLSLHPRFQISKGGTADPETGRKMPARHYSADFRYRDVDDADVVEEVKSAGTARETAYRLRRQLFLEMYGDHIKFVEIV